jgi:hypothetical protein
MVFKLYEREYKILATFPETSQGIDDANKYMADNEGAGLLATDNGTLYIADVKDEGTPISQAAQ